MPTPSAILSRARTWYAEPDQELLRFEMDWFLRWIKGGRGLALLIACAIFSFIPFVALVGWLMTYGVWLYLFQRRVSGRFAQANLQEMMVLPINGRMIWPGLLAAPFAWLVAAKILKAIVTLAWTQVLLGTETIGASAFSGAFHVPALWSAGSAFLGVFSSVAYAFAFSVMVGRHTVPRATFTRLILSTLLVMVLLGALSAVAMGALMFSPRMFIGQGIEIIWLLPLMGGARAYDGDLRPHRLVHAQGNAQSQWLEPRNCQGPACNCCIKKLNRRLSQPSPRAGFASNHSEPSPSSFARLNVSVFSRVQPGQNQTRRSTSRRPSDAPVHR